MRELRLRSQQCSFGAFAFDELTYLASDASHHLVQILIRLPDFATEKLDDAQDFPAQQNRKTEPGVQQFTPCNRGARKVSIASDIRNVYRLTLKPDAAGQADTGHERSLAASRFKCRDFYGSFMPNLNATQHASRAIDAPERADIPSQGLTE